MYIMSVTHDQVLLLILVVLSKEWFLACAQ
jgi:hypothetical protein